ncbi:MAG: hypothetical protein ACLSA6_03335 [Holdemania massiliensis]
MYEKKSTKGKAAAVILMTMILILISGFFIANSTLFNNRPVLPVNQPDAVASLHIPVVLPADETVAAPFAINAKEVLHFFEKTKVRMSSLRLSPNLKACTGRTRDWIMLMTGKSLKRLRC